MACVVESIRALYNLAYLDKERFRAYAPPCLIERSDPNLINTVDVMVFKHAFWSAALGDCDHCAT